MKPKTELYLLRFFVIAQSLIILMSPSICRADWEAKPYGALSVDYQFNSASAPYLRTDCKARFQDITRICRGTNPLGGWQLGLEFAHESWRSKWYVPVFRAGWRHQSHAFDGSPFNNKPEVWSESFMLEAKFGGLR